MVAEPVPPFVISDHGDLYVVDSLDHPGVESYDAYDFEYFDADGKRLRPIVEGYRVSLEVDLDSPPDPDRLLALINAYQEGALRRGARTADKVLLEEIGEARTLRESVLALGRYLDVKESLSIFGWFSKRKARKK